MKNENADQSDQVLLRIGALAGVLIGILFLPILLPAFLFSYYASLRFNESDRRKWFRVAQVFIIGFLITKGLWALYLHFAPAMFKGFIETRKIREFAKVTKNADMFYFLIILPTFYYFSFVRKVHFDFGGTNMIAKMKEGNILIGTLFDPIKKDLKLSWQDLNHHIHIVGQPGSGKSVLLRNIYSSQIQSGDGLLIVDLKSDLSVKEDILSLAQKAGRIKDLRILDLSNPAISYGYNPLSFGNATELKDKIIGSIEWSEPYYKKISERAALVLLRALVWQRDNKGLAPTLGDLLIALTSLEGITSLADLTEDNEIKSSLNELAANFTKDTIRDLESLRSELTLLTKSEFGEIFKNPNALNILESINTKKIILVSLDGQTYGESAKKLGRLLIGDLRAASGAIVSKQNLDERPKFTVIIDEFADIVSNDEMAKSFVALLNRCRGSGIGVVIAHQSLGDFKDDTTRAQILDSTETLFSFVQKDPETCETLASIVGTKEEVKETLQTNRNFFMKTRTGMGTERLSHEYIYHPNIFKNLGTGKAVYIAKKPTRHGLLKINMIDIPRLQNLKYEVPAAGAEQKDHSLNLGLHLQQRKTNFQKSFTESKEQTLEI